MKYVFLDGEKIGSNASLHAAFAEALAFSDYVGKNLDALHDALTDLACPVTVIAVNADALKEHVGRRWNAFLRLMAAMETEMTGFRFFSEPFAEAEEE